MAQIGRTHRSVEFSAILDELGMPWISGYNQTRDRRATRELKRMEWAILTVSTCELMKPTD